MKQNLQVSGMIQLSEITQTDSNLLPLMQCPHDIILFRVMKSLMDINSIRYEHKLQNNRLLSPKDLRQCVWLSKGMLYKKTINKKQTQLVQLKVNETF